MIRVLCCALLAAALSVACAPEDGEDGIGEEEARVDKLLSCSAFRERNVLGGSARCQRTVTDDEGNETQVDCPIGDPPACGQSSRASANVCLGAEACEAAAAQPNPAECQDAGLYPNLASCANMLRDVRNCMAPWERRCRAYEIDDQPAGCEPTWTQTDCQTVFARGQAAQCTSEC